jgi:hypothetical protein
MKWTNIPPETVISLQDLIINLNKKLKIMFGSIPETFSNCSINGNDFTVNESIAGNTTVEKEITIGNGYTKGIMILKFASNYGCKVMFNTAENGCSLSLGTTVNMYVIEGHLYPGSAGSIIGNSIQLDSVYIDGDKIKIKLKNVDSGSHTAIILGCTWQVYK